MPPAGTLYSQLHGTAVRRSQSAIDSDGNVIDPDADGVDAAARSINVKTIMDCIRGQQCSSCPMPLVDVEQKERKEVKNLDHEHGDDAPRSCACVHAPLGGTHDLALLRLPFIGGLVFGAKKYRQKKKDIFDAKSDTDRDLRAELNTRIQQLYHSQLNPSATGAAARQTTDIARVELLDRCPRSQRLSFFAEELGTASSRQRSSSWILAMCGTRICPAQCLMFAEVYAKVTLVNGHTSVVKHLLAKLRCITTFHNPPPHP